MKTKKLHKDKVNIITLGCSKNMVDSEVLSGQLLANDIEVIHENKKLDHNIVVVNTCGFIDKAKEESINTILDKVELKRRGKLDKVYVTGCLSERYKNNLEAEIPEVDAFFGTMELPLILKQFEADYKSELVGERLLATPQHYAYMKISEGCNRTCSFCAIPLMRGQHVSRSMEDLVKEAEGLVRKGVKEVMLIAQELTYYGLDIYKKRMLGDLLHRLADVKGLEWIRLHYAYPSKFPLEVLDAMRDRENICNYLDMPLQHAANNMLKAMKRQIKRDTPVMCVIGNPPYSVSSSNKSEWIEKLTADYKKDLNERNIQPLSDDYIKFIRLGQFLIDKNGSGVLAYISNNSFIDGVIHRQMRSELLKSFDKIYVVDLHGSTKKKEIALDGSSDQNVFDIMQGVSINLLIKRGKKQQNSLGDVKHYDLFGTTDLKYEFLNSNS